MFKQALLISVFSITLLLPVSLYASDGGDGYTESKVTRDVSKKSCKQLREDLDLQEFRVTEIDFSLLHTAERIGQAEDDIKVSNAKIIKLKEAIKKTSDKSALKRFKSNLRFEKKLIRSSERDLKRSIRKANIDERKAKKLRDNIKALRAHMRRNSC